MNFCLFYPWRNQFKVFSFQHENILLTFFISFICRYWNHIFLSTKFEDCLQLNLQRWNFEVFFLEIKKFFEQFRKLNFLILNLDLKVFLKSNKLSWNFSSSSRPIRFGLPCTIENKENARPYGSSNGSNDDDDDSDSNDGPILYRDDPPDRAAKIARKESLSLKLALRPERQELINRNILRLQAENEQSETKEAIGARLIRRLSMRPTADELVERNILKSKFNILPNLTPIHSRI